MRGLQGFLRGDFGQLAALAAGALLFLIVVGQLFKKADMSAKAMTFAGLALSIAFVLSMFRLFPMPMGGSVSPLSMFFVSVIGFWFGPAVGLVSGVAFGLLRLAQRPYLIHPIQMLLDYPLAFGMLGLSGFFWKHRRGLFIGFIVACTGRWVMATLSGWWFFGHFAWDGWNALPFAMAYNGLYIFAEMVITLIIIIIPPVYTAIMRVTNSAREG